MNIIELQQFCPFLRLVFWPGALLGPTRRAAGKQYALPLPTEADRHAATTNLYTRFAAANQRKSAWGCSYNTVVTCIIVAKPFFNFAFLVKCQI